MYFSKRALRKPYPSSWYGDEEVKLRMPSGLEASRRKQRSSTAGNAYIRCTTVKRYMNTYYKKETRKLPLRWGTVSFWSLTFLSLDLGGNIGWRKETFLIEEKYSALGWWNNKALWSRWNKLCWMIMHINNGGWGSYQMNHQLINLVSIYRKQSRLSLFIVASKCSDDRTFR